MAAVDDKFEGHRIRTLLESVESSINQGAEAAHTAEGSELLALLDQGVTTFRRALASVDPALVPMNQLDDAASNIEAMIPRVDAFVSNGDAAQLEAGIRPYLDVVLRVAGTISALAQSGALPDGLQASVTTFRRSAGQHIAGLANEASELRTQFDNVQSLLKSMEQQIRSHEGRLDSAIGEFQQQFSTSMEAWRTEFGSAEKERADEFSSLSAQATDLMSQIKGQSKSARARLTNDVRAQTDQLTNEVRAEADQLMEELRVIRKDAGELAAAASADSIAGDYKAAAATEHKSANVWRWISMASMGIGIALVIWLLFLGPALSDTELSWMLIARASVLAAALSAPALYARAESARHRRLARRNQKFALDIDAIGPYLANLEESERNAVRIELVGKMFAQPELNEGGPERSDGEAESLMEIISRLVGVLEKKP